jgi:hypothetical protein
MKSTKELMGEAGAASVAAYRMNREIERKYKSDPVGETYMKDLLRDLRRFIDDVTPPLSKASDFEDDCDLRGSNRMQLERINRTISTLEARRAEIEQLDNITSFTERRKA